MESRRSNILLLTFIHSYQQHPSHLPFLSPSDLLDSIYASGIRFTEIILVQFGEKDMKTNRHRLN